MHKFFVGHVCFLALISLSGCSAVAIGVAASVQSDADRIQKYDYAKSIIELQEAGLNKDTISFDEWFNRKYNKDIADYGTYYDGCKQYPELNSGGPLDYKEWIQLNPKPVANTKKEEKGYSLK